MSNSGGFYVNVVKGHLDQDQRRNHSTNDLGLHEGRRHADILGSSTQDDIAEPMVEPKEGFVSMAEELAGLSAEFVFYSWPRRSGRS
jgi:hypothetical protein